jgi:protocatechuate 3,4-dioxygenase beta subunit
MDIAADLLIGMVCLFLACFLMGYALGRSVRNVDKELYALVTKTTPQQPEAQMTTPIHTGYQESKGLNASGLTPTTPDIEGPFYKAGAPYRNSLTPHPSLRLKGRVVNERGDILPSVVLDFWQADEQGNYDEAGYALRGKVLSDPEGTYTLATVRPGNYKISKTEYRAAHIHVKLSAQGYRSITTQLYFPCDRYNEEDHWYAKSREMTELGPNEYEFHFVLSRS